MMRRIGRVLEAAMYIHVISYTLDYTQLSIIMITLLVENDDFR